MEPSSCVLYDQSSLFSSQFHILENLYDQKLLGFFNVAFLVKQGPAGSDYCKLWGTWKSATNHTLKHKECISFWEFICKNWSTETQSLLSGIVTKVPACSSSKIILIEKKDVFIPDDLLLEDLFEKQAEQPLFVWYPSASTTFLSRMKLNDIYSSIGLQRISKAVSKDELHNS